MSNYPINVHQSHWRHKGGTKEYFLTMVYGQSAGGIVIRRYGKVGKAVNILVDERQDHISSWFEKLEREREARGYYCVQDKAVKVDNSTELVAAIGPLIFPKLSKSAVKLIDPDFDTHGLRDEAAEPAYDENGKWLGLTRQRREKTFEISAEDLERARLEKEQAEAAARAAKYAAHPLYGRF